PHVEFGALLFDHRPELEPRQSGTKASLRIVIIYVPALLPAGEGDEHAGRLLAPGSEKVIIFFWRVCPKSVEPGPFLPWPAALKPPILADPKEPRPMSNDPAFGLVLVHFPVLFTAGAEHLPEAILAGLDDQCAVGTFALVALQQHRYGSEDLCL